MNPIAWLQVPTTALWIAAVVALLLVLAQGFACRRHWRDLRRIRATRSALMLQVFLVLGVLLAGAAWSLNGYRVLTAETPVLAIQARQLGPQSWRLQLEWPNGDRRTVKLAGDAWRAEAVVLKWDLPALLAGLPPVYRFDRLSSRYANPAQAARQPPTVVSFDNAGEYDLFRLALAYPERLPMVDTVYGSGAYMRLVDGARYQVNLMATGALVARRLPPQDGP